MSSSSMINDIGSELPETYSWLERVEQRFGWKILRIGKSLEQTIEEEGFLPSARTRFCTRKTKILPMEDYIGSSEATVYFGIRADEDRIGYSPLRHSITTRYPLKTAGITLPMVFAILKKHDLLPPTFFWKRLYDETLNYATKLYKKSMQMFVEPQKVLTELPTWLHDSMFAWRSRSNCYFCFFQRLYEWVGLLEHHPKLFDRC